MPEELILIGKIVKPHGLQGAIRILSYAESVTTYDSIKAIYLKNDDGESRALHIHKASESKGVVILIVDEIRDVETAEALRGRELFMDRRELAALPEGEYYQQDLIGLKVLTVEGDELGRIRNIMPTGGHDNLVVKAGKKEYLIPAIRDVIRKVDLKEGKVIIEPLVGLIE